MADGSDLFNEDSAAGGVADATTSGRSQNRPTLMTPPNASRGSALGGFLDPQSPAGMIGRGIQGLGRLAGRGSSTAGGGATGDTGQGSDPGQSDVAPGQAKTPDAQATQRKPPMRAGRRGGTTGTGRLPGENVASNVQASMQTQEDPNTLRRRMNRGSNGR